MDPFCVGSVPLITGWRRIPQVRISLRQPALALAKITWLGPRALYHRPCGPAKRHDRVNRRIGPLVPFNLWSVPVAKNLHLPNFLLIFHCDSTDLANAVSDVEMREEDSILNDEAVNPAAHAAGHQPALTGCPWHDVNEMLQAAGLRPTRQRMALGWLLFGKGARHLTAEMLYEEATLAKVPVSLATVYNTLNQLTDAGLLRQVSVDGTKTYFDTNVSAHHHFYLENNHELVDIPDPHLMLQKMPEVPEGYEIARVDMVVRLRKKR
jgi:Fur family iron response transcriptional regulator